ncbi:MAG TPA: ATP-binding cassette domain-containing protein [Mycobacteriales bacterium]|nr:ATP-binding cassette domain-containing protein [Mycobacteriales bacterium]
MPALLSLTGVYKRFGAVQALSDVSFHVDAGEVVALVGDNGAGKSTLVKSIAGVNTIDAGVIEFDGQKVNIHSPSDATRLGIATVYQDLALCDNIDVAGNLFLGREVLAGGAGRVVGWMQQVEMERQASDLLRTLSVKIPDVRIQVASLSGGQRQSVAIARSLLGEPRVVLLDEPTAALGVAQTAQVLELIQRLKDRGLGVVVISHNLADVFAVADRITVLRLGQNGGDFAVADTTQEAVVAAITGLDSGTGVRHGLPMIKPGGLGGDGSGGAQ